MRPPRDIQALDGRRFILESSQGFEPIEEAGSSIQFGFPFGVHSGREGMIGFSACIYAYAPYSIVDGRLVVVDDFMPENDGICFDRSQLPRDEWFRAFLRSRPWISLDGDRLRIIGETATRVYREHAVALPDVPLVGTRWVVHDLNDHGAGHATLPGEFVVFREDGRVSVDTPCNTGSVAFTVNAADIELRNPEFTSNPCDVERASHEDAYLRKLFGPGTMTFRIHALNLWTPAIPEPRLTLSREDMQDIAVTALQERAAE